jgi:hypothetical protein
MWPLWKTEERITLSIKSSLEKIPNKPEIRSDYKKFLLEKCQYIFLPLKAANNYNHDNGSDT